MKLVVVFVSWFLLKLTEVGLYVLLVKSWPGGDTSSWAHIIARHVCSRSQRDLQYLDLLEEVFVSVRHKTQPQVAKHVLGAVLLLSRYFPFLLRLHPGREARGPLLKRFVCFLVGFTSCYEFWIIFGHLEVGKRLLIKSRHFCKVKICDGHLLIEPGVWRVATESPFTSRSPKPRKLRRVASFGRCCFFGWSQRFYEGFSLFLVHISFWSWADLMMFTSVLRCPTNGFIRLASIGGSVSLCLIRFPVAKKGWFVSDRESCWLLFSRGTSISSPSWLDGDWFLKTNPHFHQHPSINILPKQEDQTV